MLLVLNRNHLSNEVGLDEGGKDGGGKGEGEGEGTGGGGLAKGKNDVKVHHQYGDDALG